MEKTKTLLILNASPHNNSFTSNLLNSTMGYIPKNIDFYHYNAYNIMARACDDCGYCKKKIGCKFSDLDDFLNDFENADYIFFATPIYNLSVPAPFKSIIDRFQRYFNMRFSMNIKPAINKPKKAMLLMTAGSKDVRGFEIVKEQLTQSFSVMNTTLTDEVVVSNTDTENKIDYDCLNLKEKVKEFFGG